MKTLAEWLQESRIGKKLSMRQLASQLGVSAMYISEIENGQKIPKSGKVLQELANYFDVEYKELQNMSQFSILQQEVNKNTKDTNEIKLAVARSIFSQDLSQEKIDKIMSILKET